MHGSLDVFSSTVCPSNTADADGALSGLFITQAASGLVTILYWNLIIKTKQTRAAKRGFYSETSTQLQRTRLLIAFFPL